MAKSKKAKSKKVVRGPQKSLPFVRTPRLRYMEPPTKKDGNPFVACRVHPDLLRAFKSHAAKQRTTVAALLRAHMSKVTGVTVEDDEDGGE